MKKALIVIVAIAEADGMRIALPMAEPKPEAQVDRLTRILAWYDKYLRPAAASATPQR
jgi:hypothetical protein